NVEGKILCKEDFFDENPDIQITVTLYRTGFIKELSNHKISRIIMLTVLNIPSSVNYLELNSNNPFDKQRLHLNYFEKSDDLYRMISALKLCREILKQPPLSTIYNIKKVEIYDEYRQWSTNKDDISDEDCETFVIER
ncbi:3542_t:CDS:2, partial [Racocetra persica]